MAIRNLCPGVIYFLPLVHEDKRGFSSTVWKKKEFNRRFVEHYISFSKQGVIRGLHSQPGQGKLVRVVSGKVQDVVVKLQPGRSYGTIVGELMHPTESVWIPSGYAHGFLALEDTVMEYFYTVPYKESKVMTYAWNSPKFNIPWILQEEAVPILSEKDANGIYVENK